MAKNAQVWLNNYLTNKFLNKTNVKEILSRASSAVSTPAFSERLNGELMIEDFPQLEKIDLIDVNELDKLTISNCPNLREVVLENSGVKELELGSGLDSLVLLDFSFEVNPFQGRPAARKLTKLDLSNVPNLRIFKCCGPHQTELKGVEMLTKLRCFYNGENIDDPDSIVFPIQQFHEWKQKLNTITATDPNHLDLLKGGSGPDKDDVDPKKLEDYKKKFTEYVRIYEKLGGRVNNNDLDNLLRPGLEKDRLERDLSAANSKLVKSQKEKDNARYLNITLGFISAGLFLFLVWLFREKKDFSKLEE